MSEITGYVRYDFIGDSVDNSHLDLESVYVFLSKILFAELNKVMSSRDSQQDHGNDSDEKKTATQESSQEKALSRESSQGGKQQTKKTPNDFIFGKVIGEGSFSTVRNHFEMV